MNWDWDKLTEKRQNQQGWNAGGRGNREEKPDNHEPDDFDNEGPRRPARRTPLGGGGGKIPFSGLGDVRIPGGKWWILGLLVLWLASGIYIVSPDEAGVVLRFGAYSRTTGPGPHYHAPYPIENVYKPKVSLIRQAEVGYRSQSSGGTFQQGRVQAVDEESSMLTGDENVVLVQFNIQYHVKQDGAVDYLFNVTQPDAVVKKAAEAAMREVIGKNSLDAALTRGRVQIQDDVTNLLQRILDRYQVGIEVVAVQMQSVQPPYEVQDSFKDVASARENREQAMNEAEAYRRDILPKAQGRAAEIINVGEAYKQTRILNAQGEAQRFLAVLAEYNKAQDITRKRLLFETMEEILSRPGLDKLILPSDVSGNVLPLLPLGQQDSSAASGLTSVTPAQPQSVFGSSPAPVSSTPGAASGANNYVRPGGSARSNSRGGN